MNRAANVELRQLRYFAVLAEELNFRRAAERLFITQPSLSHQVAMLEATLGLTLFRRSRQGVALTQAGSELIEDTRRILGESEALLNKAERLAATRGCVLNVGYPEFANRTAVPDMLSLFREQHPDVRLQLSEGYSRTLVQELRAGLLDLVFIVQPAADNLDKLETETVIDLRSGLLLAQHHRLATLSHVPVAALADETILLVDRPLNPPLYDMVVGWLRQSGIEPRFFNIGGPGVYSYDTAMRVIESGQAVSLSPESMLRPPATGIVFRPIEGPAPRFQIAAVWSPRVRSTARDRLLCVIHQSSAGAAAGNRRIGLTA